MSGYTEFLLLIRRFRSLSVLTVSGGAVVPFFAYLANISPPWPPGIMIITAIVELLALIIAFQFFQHKGRKIVEKSMIVILICLCVSSIIYLIGFSLLTYQGPTASTRSVKGFICQPQIKLAFGDECPELSVTRISDAQYRAEILWVEWSITIARLFLTITWLSCCSLLTSFIGIFTVFQGKQK